MLLRQIFKISLTAVSGTLLTALPLLALAAKPPQFALPPPLPAPASNTPAQPAVAKPVGSEPSEESMDCPAKFIMALCSDLDGNIYAATEDEGIWRWVPAANAGKMPAPIGDGALPPPLSVPDAIRAKSVWQQFSVKDGLSDTCYYAVACDRLGRIWCGSLRHGVDVFNGQKWQNYNVIQGLPREGQPDSDPQASLVGPLGAHVVAIATCPTDGDVWLATEAGLSRYSLSKDTWTYYTRAEGLPSDQASSLAFTKNGSVVVGTQCDGIAVSRPVPDGNGGNEYKTWEVTPGPDKMPTTPYGAGLPTGLINHILVASDSTIYAATTAGLAWSLDDGKTWRYWRGQDFADKVRGLYGGPPKDWNPPSNEELAALPAEDYITSLSEDPRGRLWLCHRRQGYEVFDRAQSSHLDAAAGPGPRIFASCAVRSLAKTDGYVTAICATTFKCLSAESVPATSTSRNPTSYSFSQPISSYLATRASPSRAAIVPFIPRSEQSAPTTNCSSVASEPQCNRCYPLFIARYGSGISRYVNASNDIDSPQPQYIGTSRTSPMAGKHLAAPLPLSARTPTSDDLTTMRTKIPTASLLSPSAFYIGEDYITQGDWTGHYGRQYTVLCAISWPFDQLFDHKLPYWHVDLAQGPHVTNHDTLRHWLHSDTSQNPKFLYNPVVGHRRQADDDDHGEAYPMNWEGPDIWATITAPPGTHRISLYIFNKDGHTGNNRFRDYMVELYPGTQPIGQSPLCMPLARCRVHNFWGSEYIQFIISDSGSHNQQYRVRINRNYSFNTICSGIFLDKLVGQYDPYDENPLLWMGAVQYRQTSVRPPAHRTEAIDLWQALDAAQQLSGSTYMQRTYRILALRNACTLELPTKLLATWRWHLNLWNANDRRLFQEAMVNGKQSETSLCSAQPVVDFQSSAVKLALELSRKVASDYESQYVHRKNH